jgi:hypothetical protein
MGRTGISRVLLSAGCVAVFIMCGPLFAVDTGIINVKDYGAQGDGVTDDTIAIRAAVTAAGATRGETDPTGVYVQTGPVLLFPEGKYIISDQINLNNSSGVLEVRGEGRPIIQQTDSSKNIFISYYAYRRSLRNITLSGGKNQIYFSNPNVGPGDIVIEHCRFYGSADFAISTNVPSNSIRVTDCEFINCKQVWYHQLSVQSTMRDCTVSVDSRMANKAAIDHRAGTLTVESVAFVPSSASVGQRWIDNYGESLTVKRCRFGSGGSGGITPIYNYRKYSGSVCSADPTAKGSTLVLEDCVVAPTTVDPTRNCLIYCSEIPNMMSLERDTMSATSAVIVNSGIDLGNYFYVESPQILSFAMRNCIGYPAAVLPSGLTSPITHPL